MEGLDIPAQWWALFHSDALNALIERSLKANPDLKAAQDALLSARETADAQRGYFYPSVTGSFSATRQQTPGSLSPATNSGALIYNSAYRASTNNRSISCHSFGGTQTVNAGTLTVLLPTNALGTAILQIT